MRREKIIYIDNVYHFKIRPRRLGNEQGHIICSGFSSRATGGMLMSVLCFLCISGENLVLILMLLAQEPAIRSPTPAQCAHKTIRTKDRS